MWNTVNEEPQLIDVILDRDQRTTSHRVLEHSAQNGWWMAPMEKLQKSRRPQDNDTANRHRHCKMTNANGTERNGRAQRHLQNNSRLTSASYDDRGVRSRSNASANVTTWLRLGSLLVVAILLTVQSAPMTLEDRRLSIPKWVNPCGLVDEIDVMDGSDAEIQLRDDQLLQQIVVQANTAKMHTELFRERYINDIFKRNLDELHSIWKHNRYEWLPGPTEIPKSLGEHVSVEHLQSLTLDETLLNTYEYLQKFAVGLEQIVWDQEEYEHKFRNEFKETEYKLRAVLCEIQVALVERGVTQRPDVTRDIMASNMRNMNSDTNRDLRDWMIFRDYMNSLEYVVQVFEYLYAHLQHAS